MKYDKCIDCGDPKPVVNGKANYYARCKSCSRKTHGRSSGASYHNWYKYKDAIGLTIDEYMELEANKPEGTVLNLVGDKLIPMSRADSTRLQKMRSDNASGYTGVYENKTRGYWVWEVCVKGKKEQRTKFDSPEDAAWSRERYVVENNITARLNFLKAS